MAEETYSFKVNATRKEMDALVDLVDNILKENGLELQNNGAYRGGLFRSNEDWAEYLFIEQGHSVGGLKFKSIKGAYKVDIDAKQVNPIARDYLIRQIYERVSGVKAA